MAVKKIKLTDQEKALIEYIQVGSKFGCPPDQILNFFNAGMLLQPKQLEMASAARQCDIKGLASSLGVGGARAGGKSAWMFAQICLDDCQRFPGLKVLFLRKSATSAREQIRDLLLKTCKNVKYNYREQAGLIEFENGSFIIIKHFKDSKDIENFLGQEYDVVAIEELTTLTFDKWKNLMTCLRTSKPNWRPRFYGAWNWGGIGHAWVKRVFHDPWKDGKQSETIYIKATVKDNRHVNDENKRILETLTGWKYKSWYLGDPDFQAGQFFTNWSDMVHVYPNRFVTTGDHEMASWFCSFDHGFAHPCCCHLHAKDRAGNTFTVDEYHQHEAVPSENAENIKAMLRRHGLTVDNLDFFVAGGDCFSRRVSATEVKTIASMYADYGIDMTPAETDRVNRWEIMGNKLGNIEKGVKPTWFISHNCPHLIEQIPLAQHHETRTGDISKMNAEAETGEGGDDALECASFGLASDSCGISHVSAMSLTSFQPITLEYKY